ncbi:outer membrane beta-barrel protein [Azospirillum sp.]|uniref:outer membrane beta-barrel protein n=1 Tax=Azospirillum sp. TaxID=34012 RepID=UPI002631733D|nr:outer membrane beta-barrel protein [Azospirillum sp.]
MLHVLVLLSATGPTQSWADVTLGGATAPKTDARRMENGAKITSEAAPESDTEGKADTQRLADSYQPKGIDLGLFLLLPKIETDESYNSNIFAIKSDVKSDFVTTIRPEVNLRSRFSEHSLSLHMVGEKFAHRTFASNDRFDSQIDLSGRYDVNAGTELTGFVQAFARHEERTSPDEAQGVKPTPTSGFIGRVGGKHETGRFVFSSEIGLQRLAFEKVATSSGSIVPNQDRNRWEVDGRLRGSYELFPGYAAVVQLSGNKHEYEQERDRNGQQRSSHGYRAEAGIGVDISQLLRGDFLVGYLQQQYRDPRFKNPQGLSLRAAFNWTPDKLTIVVPALERSVSDTTTSGASSLVRTSASVLVRHELARNILISGYGSVAYDELVGVNQPGWTYEARARVTYAFTPEVYVGSEVTYKEKDARIATSGYRQSVAMVRLGLQM